MADPLIMLRYLRTRYLRTRALAEVVKSGEQAYHEACTAYSAGEYATADSAFHVWSEAEKRKQQHLTAYRTTDVSECWHSYEIARLRAMRPCSRLVQAEMLAMASRCVNRINEMRNAA